MDHQKQAGVGINEFFNYRELPVPLPTTRVAERVMVDTDEQHQRCAKDTL